MQLFGCEINCEVPLFAHSGPNSLALDLLRAKSGRWSARASLKVDGSFCMDTYIWLRDKLQTSAPRSKQTVKFNGVLPVKTVASPLIKGLF